MRADVVAQGHATLSAVLRRCSWVGRVDARRSLIQHGTKLFIARHDELAKALFYQLVVRRFGASPTITLESPPALSQLLEMALEYEDDDRDDNGDSEEEHDDGAAAGAGSGRSGRAEESKRRRERRQTAQRMAAHLAARRAMLADYFSIGIEPYNKSEGSGGGSGGGEAEGVQGEAGEQQEAGAQGEQDDGDVVLTSLPLLLEGHEPPLGPRSVAPGALPLFLLRLVRGVDWKNEQPCFEGIAAELARFYASAFHAMPEAMEEPSAAAAVDGQESPADPFASGPGAASTWALQHRLYPALRLYLAPPAYLVATNAVVEVASLPKLYKVFERCK